MYYWYDLLIVQIIIIFLWSEIGKHPLDMAIPTCPLVIGWLQYAGTFNVPTSYH